MKSYLALIAVGLDAAATRFKSKIEKMVASVAAAFVGIGLLAGSTGDVQAACNPPVRDVCFHKSNGDWTTSGYARMAVEYPSLSPLQSYEVVWHGLKRYVDRRGNPYFTYDDVSDFGVWWIGPSLVYANFWWDPLNPWNNYSCSFYDGHYDGGEWVRGKCLFQVDFYAYQEASLVYLNSSMFSDFSLSQYYCTVEWEPGLPASLLMHGYSEGYWTYLPHQSPNVNGWYYGGDPGSPRFHYRSNCSVIVRPPPRTPQNSNPRSR